MKKYSYYVIENKEKEYFHSFKVSDLFDVEVFFTELHDAKRFNYLDAVKLIDNLRFHVYDVVTKKFVISEEILEEDVETLIRTNDSYRINECKKIFDYFGEKIPKNWRDHEWFLLACYNPGTLKIDPEMARCRYCKKINLQFDDCGFFLKEDLGYCAKCKTPDTAER